MALYMASTGPVPMEASVSSSPSGMRRVTVAVGVALLPQET